VSRRLLLPLAFLLAVFGVTIGVTGGFVTTVFGLRVSSRSAGPAVLLSLVALLAWLVAARRSGAVTADLHAADRWLAMRSGWIVAGVAALAASVAALFHSFSATGADASGYLSYTALLLDGALLRAEPLAAIAAWAEGAATLAPLGWRAAPAPGLQVPTYAIGLPLLLAPLHAAGGAVAASFVMPLTLAWAIWSAGTLARRLAGAPAAVIAAVWLATSPVAQVESMQVMSDVPVTAAWLVCWWLTFTSRPLAAGTVAALAVLIRPNLAPLTLLPGLYIVFSRAKDEDRARGTAAIRKSFGTDSRGGLQFSIPVALAGAIIAHLQWRYFGSAFRSGYGTAEEIYSLANIAPNASLYATWLLDTHGPWLLAAPLVLFGPILLVRLDNRREIRWLLAFAALVIAAYLIYSVFETWTYLRFLLPAMAIAIIAVAGTVGAGLNRSPVVVRVAGVALAVLALASFNLASAREHGVFRFADHHVRARTVGEPLRAALPVNAVIVSAEQSGAMRYYTGRSIIRWDLIDRQAMTEALDTLTRNGFRIWVVLDDWEEEPFRRKFPELAAAALDSPPVSESAPGVGVRTRAWTVPSLNLPVATPARLPEMQ
jgi:hypothetical protein